MNTEHHIIHFQMLLFVGFFFWIFWQIAFTNYALKTGKDILQLIFGLSVSVLFFFVTRVLLQWENSQLWYEALGQCVGYLAFGWGNSTILVYLMQKSQTKIKEQIDSRVDSIKTTEPPVK